MAHAYTKKNFFNTILLYFTIFYIFIFILYIYYIFIKIYFTINVIPNIAWVILKCSLLLIWNLDLTEYYVCIFSLSIYICACVSGYIVCVCLCVCVCSVPQNHPAISTEGKNGYTAHSISGLLTGWGKEQSYGNASYYYALRLPGPLGGKKICV